MATQSETTPGLVIPEAGWDGQSRSKGNRQRATARAALSKMKGDQDWIVGVDDRALDFLATGVSGQIMLELARTWTVQGMGYPTSSKLAALAERLHLQTAVAALDG